MSWVAFSTTVEIAGSIAVIITLVYFASMMRARARVPNQTYRRPARAVSAA